MNELIKRLRQEAAAWDDWNEDHPDDAAVTTPPLLREAAAAIEAAREDATPPATSPVRILIDAIESEIRQLEGKADWKSQAARIASLRAAIDQARGKGVADES